MKTLVHSRAFSNRYGKSFAPSSPLAIRTMPVTAFKLDKENRTEKEKNSSADRRKIRFSPSLLVDYTLFSYILIVDAGLTAEGFLRDRLLGGKKNLAA